MFNPGTCSSFWKQKRPNQNYKFGGKSRKTKVRLDLLSFILKLPKFNIKKKIKTRIEKAPYERAGLMATSTNSPTDSKSWNLLVQDDTDKKYDGNSKERRIAGATIAFT